MSKRLYVHGRHGRHGTELRHADLRNTGELRFAVADALVFLRDLVGAEVTDEPEDVIRFFRGGNNVYRLSDEVHRLRLEDDFDWSEED